MVLCNLNRKKKNANILNTFYSQLAGNLVKKLSKLPLKCNTDKTMMFYKKLKPNLEKFKLTCIMEETIQKLLCCLDVPKAPGMDEISKLIEKAIHIQMQEYLDKNDLIYKFQSGFTKKFFQLIPVLSN